MSARATQVVNALLIVAALAAGACACSGGGAKDGSTDGAGPESGTDAGSDATIPFPEAGPFDAWAPPSDPPGDSGSSLFSPGATFGPAFHADLIAIPDGTVGHDLDGDGLLDNELGSLPVGLVGLNSLLAMSIADGSLVTLLELRGFDDPTLGADDPEMDLVWYNGVSTAVPDEYLIDRTSLDSAGFALSVMYDTSLTGTASPPALLSSEGTALSHYIFSFDVVLPRFTGTLVASAAGGPADELAGGLFGGVVQACSLAALADPFLGSDSMLELLVGLGVAPDIDLSGDGLETFNLAPGLPARIESCTDGDGTVIPTLPGRNCACDERIEDGMSFATQFHAVAATITGVEP